MILKEFFCDKFVGTYIVNLSKKECKREDIKVECAYKRIDDNKYNITIFIGVESYDLMYEYLEDTIDSNYKNLKDKIKIYILSKINNNTFDELNEFINKRVIPEPEYLCECIGKVYKIDSPSGKKFCATVYDSKTEIQEIDINKITVLKGKYTIDEVINIIKKKESTENESKAS